MLELYVPDYEQINTKQKITIELLHDGEEFLKNHEINLDLTLDTISLVHRYLKTNVKIPHNLYKFIISSYYIISRHPFAFPMHESKAEFCENFGIQESSLDYCVDKMITSLNYIKILDDMNFPYFLDPSRDISFNIIKNFIKSKVEKEMMGFLLYNRPINSQILTEEIVCDICFDHKAFPEELFRQLYDIVLGLVEKEFEGYYEYVSLQKQYLI
jgi:hypothetical protein